MKTKQVFQDKLGYYLKGLAYTYLLTLAAIFLLPITFAIIFTGGLDGITFNSLLENDLLPFISVFFLMIAAYRVYEPFKFYIQNGISRQTVWKATMGTLILSSLLMSIVNYLYYYALILPITGKTDHTMFTTGFGKFLGLGNFWNIPVQIIYEFLLLLMFALAGHFFGSIAALVKKRTRLFLWLAVPIGMGVILSFVIRFQNEMDLHLVEKVLKFVFGYTPYAGKWNPFYPMGTMVVLNLIGMGLTYWLQRHLTIKTQ
ncbi:hypothetical protein ACLJJ6_03100 [Pediococcus siamensis]|uniref:hypothetical protein n=1 Tax=Pediococcus siamensis TaxID=381829 RepID=UPI0039A00D8D